MENRSGKYYKFVYFQRFDEFFLQFQFFLSNQKIVYYKRFDEFFHCISISEKTHGRHAFLDFQKASNIDFLVNLPSFEVLYISSLFRRWSRALVYDWSDGGDAEVVVEDIEHTELDMIEMYDDQQKEWRFHDEQTAAYQRNLFTNLTHIGRKLDTLEVSEMSYNDLLKARTEDYIQMSCLMRLLPSNAYGYGNNAHLGDDLTWQTFWGSEYASRQMRRRFKYDWFFPNEQPNTLERKAVLEGKMKLDEIVTYKSD